MVKNPVLRISVFQAGFLFALFLLFHGSVILFERSICVKAAQGKSFEDLEYAPGDSAFYRNSILSLVRFGVRERFVTFTSAEIPGAKVSLPENVFSGFERIYASLYPYPPAKAGFAWTGAILSLVLPSFLLERGIPRVMAVNFLLSFIGLILLFILSVRLFKSTSISTVICILYLTDVTLLHTNYHSQSHTMAGMVWFLGALLLFFRNNAKDAFMIGIVLALVLQTSTHFVPWSLGLLLVFFFHRGWREFLWCLGGLLVPSLYLLSVDGILGLRNYGIPGYWDHVLQIGSASKGAMSSVPILHRWMWDLRAIQPGIIWMIAIVILGVAALRRKLDYSFWQKPQGILLQIFTISSFFSFFVSLPMMRVMLPSMVFVSLFGGLILGSLWATKERVAQIVVVAILVLWSGTSLYSFDWVSETPFHRPPNTLSLDDWSAMKVNQGAYFGYLRSGNPAPFRSPVRFEYWTKTLPEFVEDVERKNISLTDLYIELRPTYLVDAYASTNRFYPEFGKYPWHLVGPKEIERDFRLYNELMLAKNSGQLGEGEFIETSREKWELGNWDHETGYWLKFKNGFRPFVQGLALETMDMRKLYYFKFSALKRLVEEKRLKPLS